MSGTTWRSAAAVLTVTAVLALGGVGCGSKGGASDGAAGDGKTEQPSGNGGADDEATTTEAEPATMPDLVELTEEEARAELADVGVEDTDIDIEEQESLSDPGTVLDQVPSSGSRISGSVTLTVAIAVGPVPDFAEQQISDVRAWAEPIGIEVREEAVLNDELPEGQVIATTPAAGKDATSEIKVQVATKPVIVSLSDIEATSYDDCGSFQVGEANVNGDFVQDSLIVTPYRQSSAPCVIEYDFGRDWESLKFTLGIEDDSVADAAVRVEVFGDNDELLNKQVVFADDEDIDISVTNILRIRIQVTWLRGDGDVVAVLGNARRIGSPDTVPTTTTTTP